MAKSTSRCQSLGNAGIRRKLALAELQQKREKGRSRNACDRCKQKKVKCDGEGMRVCSICREGDYQCNYAQKPHEEKRQYRKGYVEMVEEANGYYKSGIHALYNRFQSDQVFAKLRILDGVDGKPTVQDIISAIGVASSGKSYEGGIQAIEEHLDHENTPMLVRRGEWDRVEGNSSARLSASALSPDDDMDGTSDDLSDDLRSEGVPAHYQQLNGSEETEADRAQGRINSVDSAIDLTNSQPSPLTPAFALIPEHVSSLASAESSRGTSLTPTTPLGFGLEAGVEGGIYSPYTSYPGSQPPPPPRQSLPDLYEQTAAFNQLQLRRSTTGSIQNVPQPRSYPTIALSEVEDMKWSPQMTGMMTDGDFNMLLSKQYPQWLDSPSQHESFGTPEVFGKHYLFSS